MRYGIPKIQYDKSIKNYHTEYLIYQYTENLVWYRYGVLSYHNFRYGTQYDTQSTVYHSELPLKLSTKINELEY